MVNTPVLFETFARPDYARQVWNAIKASKPRKIYFYSNKARTEKPDEVSRNEEIRSWTKEVDWDCELHTWFREEYVDVYTSLKGAVDWVCEHEEAWITLEEDVVPTPAFFDFCDQMIDYYRDNNRVWYVSGDNFFNLNPGGYDYIFSSYHWMFGWATWRDRWLMVDWNDLKIEEMVEQKILYHLYETKEQAKSREHQILNIKDFLVQTKCWDYIFGIVCDQHNSVGVFPKQHLITNIGYSGEHHKGAKKSFVYNESTFMDSRYVIHNRPPFVFSDYDFDWQVKKQLYKQKTIKERVYIFIKRFLSNK